MEKENKKKYTENGVEVKDENIENKKVDDKSVSDATDNESKTPTIEEQLEISQKEVEELKDKYLRTVAEFANYKKRVLKEKAELVLNGSEKTVCAILPILDDFERALADKTEDVKAIKDGVQLIFNKFTKTLESLGVKKIETDGKDFDVDYHEAVAMVPGMGDEKKGKIIDCVQTGYQLNDKVIRHAKVAVGQ